MKVSLNWVKQFTDVDISVEELVEKIGAQLGAVEEVIDLGKKYEGVTVAKVIACEKHPNADKLKVCTIDDGGNTPDVNRDDKGNIQVVCGAPNVREGLLVAWLPPGSTLPTTYGGSDPLVLTARELRGVISNGMIASSKELGIGENHDGILELDIEVSPGTPFAEVYELNDYILEIENKMFTHRPDCFGILGVAREIAGIHGKKFTSPDWYMTGLDRIKPGKTKLELQVENNATELVPRFMAIAMSDISVKDSPIIIQTYLSRVGLRPINNIVDVSNYLMYLTGQPTHAFDYDKLPSKGKLEARRSKKGDKLKLLNGKDLELQDDSSVLITSGGVPVGVAGVMGGGDSEVSADTKNIVIECANFDMYSIRRTSMKYGLFTDAVARFNKGQSSLQNDIVLEEAVATMEYVSGAHVSSDVVDIYETPAKRAVVEVAPAFINERLGSSLSAAEITELLENVEFKVHAGSESLTITAPFWRTDIEIPEDIVEEVGRLYGYDKLPIELPARLMQPAKRNELLDIKQRIRDVLGRAGANELLTYSFVHGNLLERVGQKPGDSFKLTNALSPELQYFRQTLTPSLLEKVQPNIKAGFSEFALFELGKTHNKVHSKSDDGLPDELEMLALTYANKEPGVAYYHARTYLDFLAGQLGLKLHYKVIEDSPEYPVTQPFDLARSAYVSTEEGVFLGIIGEYRTEWAKKLKLPASTAGFELGVEDIIKATQQNSSPVYQKISRFPRVTQDISFRVDPQLSFGKIFDFLKDNLRTTTDCTYGFEPLDVYEKGDTKHMAFRLNIASYEKTLTDAEVNNMLDDLAVGAKNTLGIERI